MRRPGDLVLIDFPNVDREAAKLRPALVLARLPGDYGDWLICMVSSRLKRLVPDFDEVILHSDADFDASGLRLDSVIRVGRLAVVDETRLLPGYIGEIDAERLMRIRRRLAQWLASQSINA